MKEYFKDFDKLRKGLITKDQFRRVMDLMGLKLTEAEYNSLV
jgi:Ca2+-binding EF-hand superfamily protein